LARVEHRVSVTGCKAAWLSAEVKEDGIRLPTAKSTNGHFINARNKEGGGTPGVEAVGFDVVQGNIGEMEDGSSSTAEFKRDIACCDVIGSIGHIVVVVEGASQTRVVCRKVQNMVMSSQHRAENRIP
jgi:hypothetical protein